MARNLSVKGLAIGFLLRNRALGMRACLLVRRLMNLFFWDTDEYFKIMI